LIAVMLGQYEPVIWYVILGLEIMAFRSVLLMRHQAKIGANIEDDIDKFVPSFA
tara:strand:- start:208 stop:369 length:162 start_codon:yes stop_codon:yes gene_type:complete